MITTAQEACRFELLRRDGALYYHRCARCGQVLPSFDPPERTFFHPCASSGAAAHAVSGWWATNRYVRMWRALVAALRRWARARFPRPAAEELAARADACSLCPLQQHLGPRGVVERCVSCGCWLPLKRRMASELCPAERWPGQRHAGGEGLTMLNGKLQQKSGCGCGG